MAFNVDQTESFSGIPGHKYGWCMAYVRHKAQVDAHKREGVQVPKHWEITEAALKERCETLDLPQGIEKAIARLSVMPSGGPPTSPQNSRPTDIPHHVFMTFPGRPPSIPRGLIGRGFGLGEDVISPAGTGVSMAGLAIIAAVVFFILRKK